ncbi:MAG: amidohydrolase family protein [Pseudomonadota bacterium]
MISAPLVPLVDSHAHIFTTDMPLISKPRHKPGYSFTEQDYLAQLDQHGVRYGVIAAASPWGDYNEYTIRSVGNTLDRLRGTVILHPGKYYDLAAMSNRGIVGVRLPFIGLDVLPDITSSEYRKLLRQIADQGWHVHLHVEGKHIPTLLPLLETSGPRIVIDHLGRPAPGDDINSLGFKAIVKSVASGKSWMKVSCAYRIGNVAATHFQGFLQELGPDRMFWASDSPFVGHEGELTYADTIAWLADQVTDEQARRKILGENALQFYFQQ